MPRIDPLSLLKCLSVLLGPTGGIKSKEEVTRLANLMTKFSKKLVSKCIYIQILKTTNTELLSQFMGAGGWNLIHMWLTDGILAKNWALIQELLELLLLCPVDIDRLKSNNCPKLIKGLSKEGSHQGVRVLASKLVEQWLKIVKGEAAPNSVPAQIMTVSMENATTVGQTMLLQNSQQSTQAQQFTMNCGLQQGLDGTETGTVQMQDLQLGQTLPIGHQEQEQQHQHEKIQLQPVQLQIIKPQQIQLQAQQSSTQIKKQSFVVVTSSASSTTVPVYKITIRDGKQVLTKVETDASNISSVLTTNNSSSGTINGDILGDILSLKEVKPKIDDIDSGTSDNVIANNAQSADCNSSEVKSTVISSNDVNDVDLKSKDNKDVKSIISSDSNKSSDKENRDSCKKDDKKSNSSSSSSTDKKSSHHHSSSSKSSSSKTHSSSTSSNSHRSGSSSSSHRSSHRSSSTSSTSSKNSSSKDKSSKDRDKHHSSSSSKHSSSSSKSKSERDKEKEKEREKQKKDQAEKDKATLEKVQGQALSSKLGKIPKKKSEDESKSERKASTESIENASKDKSDPKKIVLEKKNISISIENRKNNADPSSRPKTVKTFNSKFRSTGLEEEVKPPPPRNVKKPPPTLDKKPLPIKLPPLKRTPSVETAPSAEKRAKLWLEAPTIVNDEKRGGIKLIPPKPKPMVLQESDMFMDALTASTKSKEPRKRKRRSSLSKDGVPEKKLESSLGAEGRDTTPPLSSPISADEKSPIVVKPALKFYQDTLETDEDKESKDKDGADNDEKREEDGDARERDNDDDGSNTPTPDDDMDDKPPASPEDGSSEGTDSRRETSEIRYVDGLRSVLLLQKRKGPKKSLKWKTDLESIRYFELDETERVNVTKTSFTDMKQMEKQNERAAFQMARKLCNEDLMEERTRWKPLIPIDLPPPLVEPGKDSKERETQYIREKGILQALYFNRSMIPDSAAEPDDERHLVPTEPKAIPLDDLTGNKESEKDFSQMSWPDPKPLITAQQPHGMGNFHYQSFPHSQQPAMLNPMGPQGSMSSMAPIQPQMIPPVHMQMAGELTGPMSQGGAGGWRTGDGKVVVPDVGLNTMGNMPSGYAQGIEPGNAIVPPGMMPPMYNQQQDNYMMGPDEMGYNNMNPNNFQGPPPMFGPGPNFQGHRGGGGPMHRGRGGPGPGWFRGGGGGPMRGGGWRGGGGGWRGNGKQPPVCRQFSKNGYCRVGDKCQYLHPGVNCPPY